MRVVTTTSGTHSEAASARPASALGNGGPEVSASTAGWPEAIAWAAAIQAPARWSRTITRRSPFASASSSPGSSDGTPTTRSQPASARVAAAACHTVFIVHLR